MVAVDVARPVGGEEEHGIGDVVGSAERADGDARRPGEIVGLTLTVPFYLMTAPFVRGLGIEIEETPDRERS